MRRIRPGVLALLVCLGIAPARAQDDAFCTSLKAARKGVKADPASIGELRIAGATLCAPLEGSLQCNWLVGTQENGRGTFERLKSEAAACLAPDGLKPTAVTVAGSETSLLEGDDGGPAVAIVYPGHATVGVTILKPD